VQWPWIGREHHEEVVGAKNAQIRWQQETIAALEARLAAPVSVTVKLPDDFAMVTPAIVSHRRRKPVEDAGGARKEEEPIDWANLDENNPEDLARVAAREIGGKTTPYVLAQTVARIKTNIVREKLQRNRRTLESSSVGTIPSAEPGIPSPHPDYVPAHIQRMIDSAAEGK
jgi:hypothetical protein